VTKAREHGCHTTSFFDDDFDVETWAVGPVPREHESIFAGYRLA